VFQRNLNSTKRAKRVEDVCITVHDAKKKEQTVYTEVGNACTLVHYLILLPLIFDNNNIKKNHTTHIPVLPSLLVVLNLRSYFLGCDLNILPLQKWFDSSA